MFPVEDLLQRVRDLRDEHNSILPDVDTARARVVTVQSLFEEMDSLPDEPREHLRVAVGCIEHGFYRPAIVMAWAAVFDAILEFLESDGFTVIHTARPKWGVFGNREELTERHTEHAIIEALEASTVISKTLKKTLHSQLHTRNRAAHAGTYRPTLNTTLGYVEDAIDSLRRLPEP